MSTHEHTPDELEHALRVIRSECRAHPESCTECPLSFNDGGPILFAGRMGHFANAALAGVHG